MLQSMRKFTTGWFAVVLVGILAVPFAFFGMEQYLFQINASYAARVQAPPTWWKSAPHVWPVTALAWREQEVSAEEFRIAFEQARQAARTQQGEAFDARTFETVENKRRVLDQLIDRAVARLAAGNSGLAIGDAQVRSEIQSIPSFQVEGRFDPQRYQLVLQSQNPPQSPKEFEERVRAGLEEQLVPMQVANSAFVTPAEMERLMRLLGEKRDVTFALLPPPSPDAGAIAAKDIQDWYAAHPADYRAPETVAFEYVDIDGSTLPAPAAADEATLRARYEQEKARFVEPAQRLASHVLVRMPEGGDAAAQKVAEDKAAKIAAEAKAAGADFAAIARAQSDDEGSKEAGGDLGWIERGTMEGPFEDALFAMQPGEVRGPVKSDFGWHVIQLREARDGASVPFEQARDTLAQEQATSDRERVFNDLVGRVVDQVNLNPTALAPAAEKENLPVQTVAAFARGQGTGVAANAAVERAAFSEALVEDGTVSDPIEITPGRSVLVRVTEHQPARTRPLAEVRADVVAAIRADRAEKALAKRADALVEKLKAGTAFAAVAAEAGIEPQSIPGLTRGMPVPDPVAVDAFFEAAPPKDGKPTPGRVALENGGIAVFAVDKVTPGDPTDASPQERQMLEGQLRQLTGAEDGATLVRTLRRGMKIEVVEARL